MRFKAFMLIASGLITAFSHAAATGRAVLVELGRFLTLCLRSRAALAAENLFLRKQLALFEERKAQPHRANDAVRFVMSALGRLFDWRNTRPERRSETRSNVIEEVRNLHWQEIDP